MSAFFHILISLFASRRLTSIICLIEFPKPDRRLWDGGEITCYKFMFGTAG